MFWRLISEVINTECMVKVIKKYKSDIELKHKFSLFTSTGINIIYAIFKFISGIMFRSIWFISFSLYYILLVILKINIIGKEVSENKTLKNEYLKYRQLGIILLFLNVILSIIILVLVNEKIMIIYPEVIAIGIATYTFYILTESIVNLIKYRNFKKPLMSATKIINVVSSLISMLSLEIVLLSVYGKNMSIENREIWIMLTGGGIAIIITMISIYMIIKSTEWLKSN